MKNTFKAQGSLCAHIFAIAFVAIIGLAITACPEPEPETKTPTLTGTVNISGTTQVGQTLTANTGSLGGNGIITYHWKRGTTDIGTNSSTYVVQTADVGSTITVTVTRSGYSGSVTSSPTAIVTSGSNGSDPTLTGTVSITGSAQVGQTLTVNTNSLGGSGTITYLWKRGSTNIGSNSNTYTVQAADVGSTITVTVTRSGYSSSITSNPIAVITEGPGLAFTLLPNGTAYSVSKGTSTAAIVVIPAVYNEKPVTTIADSGFYNYTNMMSITIPDIRKTARFT